MKRGFTIVEVLVVIGVITLLATIVTTAYVMYQDRSYDAQARGLANSVRAGAERYFNRNNDYPSGTQLSNLATAHSMLGVPIANLDGPNVQLRGCAGVSSTCIPNPHDKTKVYYLTKLDSDGTAARSYSITLKSGSTACTYSLPSGESIRGSYLLAYWSSQDATWKVARSSQGRPTTSNATTCPFTAL